MQEITTAAACTNNWLWWIYIVADVVDQYLQKHVFKKKLSSLFLQFDIGSQTLKGEALDSSWSVSKILDFDSLVNKRHFVQVDF